MLDRNVSFFFFFFFDHVTFGRARQPVPLSSPYPLARFQIGRLEKDTARASARLYSPSVNLAAGSLHQRGLFFVVFPPPVSQAGSNKQRNLSISHFCCCELSLRLLL